MKNLTYRVKTFISLKILRYGYRITTDLWNQYNNSTDCRVTYDSFLLNADIKLGNPALKIYMSAMPSFIQRWVTWCEHSGSSITYEDWLLCVFNSVIT